MKIFVAFLIGIAPLCAADLLVAAASDLAPLGPKLEIEYAKQTGQQVRFTFSSSGLLTRQIENGAPYDVFLSAGEQYVKDLASAGHVDSATMTLYALGRLGLWSPDGSAHQLSDLSKLQIKRVAIANPDTAPYGLAAKQALEHQGLWPALKDKLIYGENVRQALQFAESRNVDAVIASWTLLKGRGELLPAEWHQPIRQTGAVVKTSSQADAGRRFLAFLGSPAVRKILEDDGLFPPVAPVVEKAPVKRPAKQASRKVSGR
jgi:molybdate transport system substrate-binding protein